MLCRSTYLFITHLLSAVIMALVCLPVNVATLGCGVYFCASTMFRLDSNIVNVLYCKPSGWLFWRGVAVDPIQSEARERVLVAAEQLFAEKGYGPVTLRQIGAKAGLNHSSLYHHVPGGKEDLFVEVMERIFALHRAGISTALAQAGPDLRAQLYAVANWLLSQPPMDLVRMAYVDMPELGPANVHRLSEGAYEALQIPVEHALAEAQRRGVIDHDDFALLSGGLIGMIQSLFAVSEEVAGKRRRTMAHRLIDVLLDGLRPR